MRNAKAVLAAILLCLGALHAASAEEPLWTDGTLDVHGHSIVVHAMIHDALPAPLQQIRLQGQPLEKATFHQALAKHFTLHPDFSLNHCQAVDDFYISEWATGCSALAGYDARLVTNCEVERLYPVEDPALRSLYAQCVAFLADLGIEAAAHAGYICRQSQKGSEYIVALLPYQIEGLSTEYKNQLVNRDRMPWASGTGRHIMDYPWADFVFDSQARLVKAEMSSYRFERTAVLSGQAIPWAQAAESVLEAVIASRIGMKKSLEHQADYDEAQFWAEYRVQLARVTPMWMPNWANVCTPGWCVQYQLYDQATGEFLFSMAYCADALTGAVAGFGQ